MVADLNKEHLSSSIKLNKSTSHLISLIKIHFCPTNSLLTLWVQDYGFFMVPTRVDGERLSTRCHVQRSFLVWGWAVPLEDVEVLVSTERSVMMSWRALLT